MKRCLGHVKQTAAQKLRNITPKRCNKKIYEGIREGDYCFYHIQNFLYIKALIIQKNWKMYKAKRIAKLYKKLPTEIQQLISFNVRQDHHYQKYKKTIKKIVLNKFTPELQKTFINYNYLYEIINIYNIENIKKIRDFILFLRLVEKYFTFLELKDVSNIIKYKNNFDAIYFELTQIQETQIHYEQIYKPLKIYFHKIWTNFKRIYYLKFREIYILKTLH